MRIQQHRYGVRDNLSELDGVDLTAISIAQVFGWLDQSVVVYKVRPCRRPCCGGTVLTWGQGDRYCLLCSRPPLR